MEVSLAQGCLESLLKLVSYSLIVIVYLFFVPRLETLLLIANSCEAICGPLTNSCYYCSVLMSFFLFVLILSQLISKKCKNKSNKGKNTHKNTKNKNRKQRKCAKIFPTVVVPQQYYVFSNVHVHKCIYEYVQERLDQRLFFLSIVVVVVAVFRVYIYVCVCVCFASRAII